MPFKEPDHPMVSKSHPSCDHHHICSEECLDCEDGCGTSEDEVADRTRNPSKRERLSGLTSRTETKTRKFLSMKSGDCDASLTEDSRVLGRLAHNPVFAISKLDKRKKFKPGKKAGRALETFQAIGHAVVHPKDGLKKGATRTTAGQLSKVDRPYLSREADLKFLQAHDDLDSARSHASSRRRISDEGLGDFDSIVDSHRTKIRDMEEYRESLKVAWFTSRHVRRVRVVPKRHMNFPNDEYFAKRNDKGEMMGFDWLDWLGHSLIYYTQDFSAQYIDDFDELPFDIDSMRHYVERLVIASAPWQSWIMNVRAIYQWEEPTVTMRWFILYLIGWYTEHLAGMFLCYVMYIVLMNRYAPASVESLRSSVQKALHNRSTASKFGELIDKHGGNDWLEKVLEHFGPFIQLQLGDMANMLEVLSNFYHWKYPRKTISTLIFVATCLIFTLFADMGFCMKIFWFVCGGAFFLCWPISSMYPKYRYLVSPIKWILWGIPTDAEWSFQYLRLQAQLTREQVIEQSVEDAHCREVSSPTVDHYSDRRTSVPKIRVANAESEDEDSDPDDDGWYSASSSTSVLEARDIRSFRAQHSGCLGRLIVYSKGIRFLRSFSTKEETWRCDYLDLAEMRKVEGSTISKLRSGSSNQLEIKLIDGSKVQFEGMKERDEVFNTIIGFSSLQWQSLQILTNTKAQA